MILHSPKHLAELVLIHRQHWQKLLASISLIWPTRIEQQIAIQEKNSSKNVLKCKPKNCFESTRLSMATNSE
jgi:hypothetical protein